MRRGQRFSSPLVGFPRAVEQEAPAIDSTPRVPMQSSGDLFATERFGGFQEAGVSFRNDSASSEAKKSKKPSGSGPALTNARWSYPASTNCLATARRAEASGPTPNT